VLKVLEASLAIYGIAKPVIHYCGQTDNSRASSSGGNLFQIFRKINVQIEQQHQAFVPTTWGRLHESFFCIVMLSTLPSIYVKYLVSILAKKLLWLYDIDCWR